MEGLRRGASILFVNDKREILLMLRDDNSDIPYPNCWTIPGGLSEEGETFETCITREMQEEMEIILHEPELFRILELKGNVAYIFWQKANFEIADINLHEGQRIQWFSEEEINKLDDYEIAFGFKNLILDFFEEQPFAKNLLRKLLKFNYSLIIFL